MPVANWHWKYKVLAAQLYKFLGNTKLDEISNLICDINYQIFKNRSIYKNHTFCIIYSDSLSRCGTARNGGLKRPQNYFENSASLQPSMELSFGPKVPVFWEKYSG